MVSARTTVTLLATLLLFCGPATLRAADAPPLGAANDAVSFHKQIRPVFQARCLGCHQPAKAKGKYVMTAFDKLVAGGSSGDPAIVPGDAAKSFLIEQITPVNGKAEMPPEGDPLTDPEIALIRKWIEQGAKDDTPNIARERIDAEHPPIYKRPPVITSIDYSPDGSLLAVAGFHEVLLVSTSSENGVKLEARLVGMSQRIASVRFSPDGTKLAVTGGLPARVGEVQVWDVAKRKLAVSVPVTYDTIYGASWSPDGKIVAVACADNSVRAFDAESGKQIFFNAAHNDWALDTVFSLDGKRLISVGRDMTTKLYEFQTERFVDNITSITPGALKGGILAIARHPKRDEIVIGGSDGQPKVYRMERLTKRVIGDDANVIRWLEPMRGRVTTVAVSSDGKMIAAGSSLDGKGQVFVYAYDFDGTLPDNIKKIMEKVVTQRSQQEKEAVEAYKTSGLKTVAKLELPEAAVYSVAFRPDGKVVAAAGSDGTVRFIDTTSGAVIGQASPAPIDPSAQSVASVDKKVDFIRDVNPILSRVGCNAGTCHGAANGKNGFKLSLRGYDAIFDVRGFTDDHASRRISLASPDNSLMLLKATGAVPHEGGQRFKEDSDYYRIVRDWIAQGAKLDLNTPRVVKIDLTPVNPLLQKADQSQAMKVVATYADGATRDVTREAFVSTGNLEVAKADDAGVVTALRRGEAPILARYEGAYTATTLTVMGDRSGFAWKQPDTWNKVDELTAAKWQRMKIEPSELCSDAEFLRRVSLDLTGLPPTPEEVSAFLADTRPAQVKRNAAVDRLIGSDAYVEYWTNKWADLLQVNSKFLGGEGATAFRAWIREQVAGNTPYDKFAREILTAEGSNREHPAASYYKILRDPGDMMENTTQLFLAVRFSCNKCHDHPFEKWTQDQYYETAAFFARVDLKPDPASGNRKIGGTAVEGAKPLYEIVYDKDAGEVTHIRTQDVASPEFPFESPYSAPPEASRRVKLAAWITSPDNPYFARSYVNRLWGYLFGAGIIEPLDDIRAGNPPTNPQLLDYLTGEFLNSGFDVRHMHQLICKSRTYQLSYRVTKWNEDDKLNYSHRIPKRLPAEAMFDAVYRVTGSTPKIPGVAPGTRAAMLADAQTKAPGDFLTTLGRPARESACECERKDELHLGSVMAIISGPAVADAIADPGNAIAKLVADEKDDRKMIDAMFVRILNRHATDNEVQAVLREMAAVDTDHTSVMARLQKRESELAPTIQKEEAARQAAIAKAKADLDAYEKEVAPKIAAAQKAREESIKKLEGELKEAETGLVERLAEWELKSQGEAQWVVLDPTTLKSTNGAKLEMQPDGSIFVTGNNGKTEYEFIAETALANITAIRLEALSDDRLPSKGPGRAPNGNYVLSEFELQVAAKDKPDKFRKVALQNAVADFSQENYDVKTAIDGKAPPTGNGWAASPKLGESHTALFETKGDLNPAPKRAKQNAPANESGSILKFTLNQQFQDDQHTLGKFRISVTSAPRPVTLGPPPQIAAMLKAAPDQRDDKQKAELLKYYRTIDPMLTSVQEQLAEARKPVPEDPGLKPRRDALADASKPLAIDPKLATLREIAATSEAQLKNKRLTIAQDLAWALINSPAFLFNH